MEFISETLTREIFVKIPVNLRNNNHGESHAWKTLAFDITVERFKDTDENLRRAGTCAIEIICNRTNVYFSARMWRGRNSVPSLSTIFRDFTDRIQELQANISTCPYREMSLAQEREAVLYEAVDACGRTLAQYFRISDVRIAGYYAQEKFSRGTFVWDPIHVN